MKLAPGMSRSSSRAVQVCLTSPSPEPSVQGGITAAMPGGSFVGALVSGYLTDKLGRRRAIQIGTQAQITCLDTG